MERIVPPMRTAGRVTRVHVNGHKIRANAKHGTRDPVIAVRQGKAVTYAHEAVILDQTGHEAARIVYSPDRPLSCGARLWIETRGEVVPIVHELEVCANCGNDLAAEGHPFCIDCLEEIGDLDG